MTVYIQPYTHTYKHIHMYKLTQGVALIVLIDLRVTGLKVVVITGVVQNFDPTRAAD